MKILFEYAKFIPSVSSIFYILAFTALFVYTCINRFSFLRDIFVWKICDKNILILTAHPDDECMFFGPLLLNLILENKVSLFCLTTGNFYKIGDIRKTELVESAEILGISSNDVYILDKKDLPDDPSVRWDDNIVCQEILKVCSHLNPDIIITFDDYGVSGHGNHIALNQALRKIVKEKLWRTKLSTEPIAYSLDSVPVWRKYISFIDILFTISHRQKVFISSLLQVLVTQRAMFAHRSQLMWFRRLYIIFSRYMFINTMKEIKDS